jgi:hypothetical protein
MVLVPITLTAATRLNAPGPATARYKQSSMPNSRDSAVAQNRVIMVSAPHPPNLVRNDHRLHLTKPDSEIKRKSCALVLNHSAVDLQTSRILTKKQTLIRMGVTLAERLIAGEPMSRGEFRHVEKDIPWS